MRQDELARQADYDHVVVNETGPRSTARPSARSTRSSLRRTAASRSESRSTAGDAIVGEPMTAIGLSRGRPAPSSRSPSTPRVSPAGRRSRTAVPDDLADVVPGEAVLVEFGQPRGRRRGPGGTPGARRTATAGRSWRASAPDGPLLRELQARLAAPRRRALPRAAGHGRAGDAAAGPARAGRAGRAMARSRAGR